MTGVELRSPQVYVEKPKTPEDLIPIHLKKSDVAIEAAPSFQDAAGSPTRALVDADHHAQVDVLSMPTVEVAPSFQDSAGTPQRALVDADKHAQVDVLTAPNPSNLDVALSTRASESTLGAVRDRLPSSLTTAGNLKTAIQEDAVGLVKSSQLPSSLTASGNLKIAVQEDAVGLAKSSDISATQPRNLTQIAGTALTGRDWSGDFAKLQNLDVLLSSRAASSQLPSSLTTAGNLKAAIMEDAVGLAKSSDLSAVQPRNLTQIAGTALTGRDWSGDFQKLQNLDVFLSTRASESTFRDAVSASGSVAAANNTAGLSVSVNNDFRDLIHFRATLGGAGNIYVEASFDGSNWFTMWSKSLTAAGTLCDWELCGAPYFRIRVPTTGIDIAINVRGVKL
jgi:hypothetical protein